MGDPKRIEISLVPAQSNQILVYLPGSKASMDDFTHAIEPMAHMPVLNHTGLTGE